jgi:hypothetical protein
MHNAQKLARFLIRRTCLAQQERNIARKKLELEDSPNAFAVLDYGDATSDYGVITFEEHALNSGKPISQLTSDKLIARLYKQQNMAVAFQADLPTALHEGGYTGFVRAFNKSLREFGIVRPISERKEIRECRAKMMNHWRQNSSIQSFEYPSEGDHKCYKEFGKIPEVGQRTKPSNEAFSLLRMRMSGSIITPWSTSGKQLLKDSEGNGYSYKKVGVKGWCGGFQIKSGKSLVNPFLEPPVAGFRNQRNYGRTLCPR